MKAIVIFIEKYGDMSEEFKSSNGMAYYDLYDILKHFKSTIIDFDKVTHIRKVEALGFFFNKNITLDSKVIKERFR